MFGFFKGKKKAVENSPRANDEKSTTEREYCEVLITEPKYEVNRYVFRFFARATTPSGEVYNAGIAKEMCVGRQPLADDKHTLEVLNDLKVRLISEAWELMPRKGRMWYSLRFSRPIKNL